MRTPPLVSLLVLALSGCAVIRERELPPRVTTRSEPLPVVRLSRKDRVRAEHDLPAKTVTLTGIGACEQTSRQRITTTIETERVATQHARELVPFAVGVALGALASATQGPADPDGGCRDACPMVTGAVLGAVGSGIAALIDGAREANTTERRTEVVLKTYEHECASSPITLTPVLLVFDDGTRLTATTDGAGRVVVPGATGPVSVEVGGRLWPIETANAGAQ